MGLLTVDSAALNNKVLTPLLSTERKSLNFSPRDLILYLSPLVKVYELPMKTFLLNNYKVYHYKLSFKR